MRTEISDIFRGIPLFEGARAETIERLAVGAFVQWFPPEVTLHGQGLESDFLFILLEGAVEQTAGQGPTNSTLHILRPMQPFGLASCVVGAPSLFGTRTLERSRILMVSCASMREALAEDAGLSYSVLRHVAQAWVNLATELHNHKVHNSAERLAHWILNEVDEDGTLELPFQKRRLAALVGTTPENLSRNIAQLREYGVAFEGRRVVVNDIDALRSLAASVPLDADRS
jgi:CRP/FNR family transcriptional regulator, transcriptional activator FtrB